MWIKTAEAANTTANIFRADPGGKHVQAAANHAASTSEFAIDPITIILWVVAVVAVIAVWYACTEHPYNMRKRRPVGVGPATHLRNTIVNRISSFLP